MHSVYLIVKAVLPQSFKRTVGRVIVDPRVQRLIRIMPIFIKGNGVPLKWRILFLQSVFITQPVFGRKFYKLLQANNRGDHYEFHDLKVTFLPCRDTHKRTAGEYFAEGFLVLVFPSLYGGDIYHPMCDVESNYFDDKNMHFKSTDIVFDCGANVGLFTIGIAKRAHKGHIFAFEPFPENAELLLRNVRQNSLDNVTLIQKAVCDVEKQLVMNFDHFSPASSGIYNKPVVEDPRVIQGITIDQIYREYNLERVDFIKMDIEGMERDAIKGATEVISKFKPRLSICTYHLPDDPVVLPELIKGLRSDYTIEMKVRKLYAY